MHAAAVTPKPIPGGPTLGQIAGNELVAFEYEGTEFAEWKEGSIFGKTTFQAQRDVTTRDTVFAMPHYTPSYRHNFVNGWTRNTPSVDRFVSAGSSFDDALAMAARMNGNSVDGMQPVAIVQADKGRFFLAPLGYYENDKAFVYGGWTRPGTILGNVATAGKWTLNGVVKGDQRTPAKVPGDKYDSSLRNGQLTKVVPLHDAVKAVVDRNGWYDLRAGAVDAAAAAQAVA